MKTLEQQYAELCQILGDQLIKQKILEKNSSKAMDEALVVANQLARQHLQPKKEESVENK